MLPLGQMHVVVMELQQSPHLVDVKLRCHLHGVAPPPRFERQLVLKLVKIEAEFVFPIRQYLSLLLLLLARKAISESPSRCGKAEATTFRFTSLPIDQRLCAAYQLVEQTSGGDPELLLVDGIPGHELQLFHSFQDLSAEGSEISVATPQIHQLLQSGRRLPRCVEGRHCGLQQRLRLRPVHAVPEAVIILQRSHRASVVF